MKLHKDTEGRGPGELWCGGHRVVAEKREIEVDLVGVTWGWNEWAASELI